VYGFPSLVAPAQIQNVPLFGTLSGLAAKTKQHADLQKQCERQISKFWK
jgi:hypothetical protein